ncbi:hypothetical protein FHR84_003599 [Actinopolyspora biskrensis]|uniref:Uncharacterized protein n=1 Tax=Actinopolyspora biskrensis TaxID=1470178 RepID=A0A852Z237_9ACTN|nr:hypothetical protein [Actinopolyspora biskrensis]NYH80250.1 hypothetical protein [Actinopolyspora biskrensis]
MDGVVCVIRSAAWAIWGEVVGGELDRDGRFVAVAVEGDGELGDLEQPAEQFLRGVGEVQGEVGQVVQ